MNRLKKLENEVKQGPEEKEKDKKDKKEDKK